MLALIYIINLYTNSVKTPYISSAPTLQDLLDVELSASFSIHPVNEEARQFRVAKQDNDEESVDLCGNYGYCLHAL